MVICILLSSEEINNCGVVQYVKNDFWDELYACIFKSPFQHPSCIIDELYELDTL